MILSNGLLKFEKFTQRMFCVSSKLQHITELRHIIELRHVIKLRHIQKVVTHLKYSWKNLKSQKNVEI